jgi:hypothetical protein
MYQQIQSKSTKLRGTNAFVLDTFEQTLTGLYLNFDKYCLLIEFGSVTIIELHVWKTLTSRTSTVGCPRFVWSEENYVMYS